jgi:hypothetical protein
MVILIMRVIWSSFFVSKSGFTWIMQISRTSSGASQLICVFYFLISIVPSLTVFPILNALWTYSDFQPQLRALNESTSSLCPVNSFKLKLYKLFIYLIWNSASTCLFIIRIQNHSAQSSLSNKIAEPSQDYSCLIRTEVHLINNHLNKNTINKDDH